MARAIKRGDLDAYMKARDAQEEHLKAEFIRESYTTREWRRIVFRDTREEDSWASVAIEPEHQEPLHFDTSAPIKDFDSLSEMKRFFCKPSVIEMSIRDHNDYDHKVPGVLLGDLYVSPALRGTGAGTYIMKTIEAYADKKGLVVDLVPTEAGDGRLESGQPGYEEAAEAHRDRLIAFYERHGFTRNPFFFSYSDNPRYPVHPARDRSDELAWKEEQRPLWTRKGEQVMSDYAEFVRFPKGKVPPGYIKPTPKPSV